MSSSETPTHPNDPGEVENGFSIDERRNRPDRRGESIPVLVERRAGLDRRIEAEKRRMVDPVTCEKEYSDDEVQFMNAMDQYKRSNRRPFPTWTEVLEVLCSLGYRKVADPKPLPGLPIQSKQKE